MCVPAWSEKSGRPASLGRYGEIALFQHVGRTFSSGGITKKIPANVAIAPAVLRTIAPIAEREEADEHQVDGAADHDAGDAGARERDLKDVMPVEDRLAREER